MEANTDNCDNCYNRHITSAAVNWCSNCEEGLCSVCTQHHQASRQLRSHSLISISDYHKLPHYIRDVNNYCRTHEEPFQLYCQTHEQCCCISCVEETHSECKDIKALIDLVKDVKFSPALDDIETCLKQIISVYDNIREIRTENKSRLKEQKEQIIAEVHGIRKTINDHLDKLVSSIKNSISTEFEATNLKIDEVLTEVEGRQKNVSKLVEEEETIKQLSTDLQTFLGLPFFQCRIQEETKYIENLRKDHKVDELDLIFETSTLDSFCETNDSFGSVSVTEGVSLIDINIGKKETAQISLPKNEVCAKLVSNLHRIQYPKGDAISKITGCTILPSGQVLFIDNDKLVISSASRFQFDYREIIVLNGMCYVTSIGSTKAAVTLPQNKKIVLIDLLLGKQLKTFSINNHCWGIEHMDGNLIMKSTNAFLQMDEESGDIVKRIKTSNCQTCVTVSNKKIFGCNHEESIIYCFHTDGDELWKFHDKILKIPQDLTSDSQGFVYVTGKDSNNVIVISPDGKTCQEILNESDGLDDPDTIYYEKTLDLLLVCNEKKQTLIICDIK